MDLWNSFWSALAEFIADNGLVAVALIVLLRSAAVPIPVPADLLVVLVGAKARENHLVIWPAWLLLALSTTLGAVVFYAFVRWIGQGDVSHYGRYVGLTDERLTSAETRLGERGTWAVIVARIVPGLRLAIVAVCGMLRFHWWKFVAAVLIGALIYVGLCLAIGYAFGEAIVGLVGDLVFPLGLLEPVLGLSLLLFWLVRARRTTPSSPAGARLNRASRVRVGALAGALAICGSSMLLNAIVYLVVPIAADAMGGIRGVQSVVTLSGASGGILVVILDSILFGIAWGIVYGLNDGRSAARWSDWKRGLTFAIFPFVLVVLVQWLVLLQSRPSVSVGVVFGLAEAIRWSAYGVLIGLTYPVLRARRLQARPTEPPTRHATLVADSGN